MRFILLLYSEESGWSKLTSEEQRSWLGAYGEYHQSLSNAGVLRTAGRLQASAAATTVRRLDGAADVQDGSHGASREQLGGYFVIDVPDLDAAIDWALRCPGSSHGAVEVRPLHESA